MKNIVTINIRYSFGHFSLHSIFNFSDIKAQILGPEEIYVKKGSTINLTCRADSQNHSPSNLTWYHVGTMIDFDNPR